MKAFNAFWKNIPGKLKALAARLEPAMKAFVERLKSGARAFAAYWKKDLVNKLIVTVVFLNVSALKALPLSQAYPYWHYNNQGKASTQRRGIFLHQLAQ
jgi:hypothetical protein